MAVFGEAPLAAGVCTVLSELGYTVTLVGLRGRSLGGEDELRRVLGDNGLALEEGCAVLEASSLHAINSALVAELRGEGLDGAVDSATELNLMGTVPEDCRGDGRGPVVLELGFPCRDPHALMQLPLLLFLGMVGWLPWPSGWSGPGGCGTRDAWAPADTVASVGLLPWDHERARAAAGQACSGCP